MINLKGIGEEASPDHQEDSANVLQRILCEILLW